jgi:hypothetical protein
MPRERMAWRPMVAWGAAANGLLRRLWELAEGSTRTAVIAVASSQTLALSWPFTLVRVTTTGGNVTLTLPPAATVVGYRVDVKKITAANTLTLDGDGSETIDGAATLAWTVQYQSYTVVSDGTAWSIV